MGGGRLAAPGEVSRTISASSSFSPSGVVKPSQITAGRASRQLSVTATVCRPFATLIPPSVGGTVTFEGWGNS